MMNLVELWKEKLKAGAIRFDYDVLAIRSGDMHNAWGTVYYSEAREVYKCLVSQSERSVTFDPELMSRLKLADFGGLVIAANPNSLFPGHLVIYPKIKAPDLTGTDLLDITRLAQQQPRLTFIHNMERSAASIVDWAHYQAYAIEFPVENAEHILLDTLGGVSIIRTPEDFPAYALAIDSENAELVSGILLRVLGFLSAENPHGRRIPVNFIWKRNRVWIVPRSLRQSDLAARYFGGLEMGGIFCLPNADELRNYLPEALRKEVHTATFACEPEHQAWFEENLIRFCRLG